MTAPIPEPYVTARLHQGPRDGETIQMPWARYDIRLIRWEEDVMLEDHYQLSGPWRGQATADYRYCEPTTKQEAA